MFPKGLIQYYINNLFGETLKSLHFQSNHLTEVPYRRLRHPLSHILCSKSAFSFVELQQKVKIIIIFEMEQFEQQEFADVDQLLCIILNILRYEAEVSIPA